MQLRKRDGINTLSTMHTKLVSLIT